MKLNEDIEQLKTALGERDTAVKNLENKVLLKEQDISNLKKQLMISTQPQQRRGFQKDVHISETNKRKFLQNL